jgi:predicted DCC family thiol-disulfide oxidoreductase YuxK
MATSGAAKPVLVFDGDCGFCTSTANWIVKHSKVAIDAQPYQWAKLDDFGLTREESAARVQLIADGKIFSGHFCMAKLLLLQPNALVKILGAIMVLPGLNALSAKVYDLIAANRHRLPGGTPACRMPSQKR